MIRRCVGVLHLGELHALLAHAVREHGRVEVELSSKGTVQLMAERGSGDVDLVSLIQGLTEKQRLVLGLFTARAKLGSAPPSYLEIAAATGASSTNAASQMVVRLVRKGLLVRPANSRAGAARSYVLAPGVLGAWCFAHAVASFD